LILNNKKILQLQHLKNNFKQNVILCLSFSQNTCYSARALLYGGRWKKNYFER
jgi:hypothetical protein